MQNEGIQPEIQKGPRSRLFRVAHEPLIDKNDKRLNNAQ